ncbi:MAG TPA: tripartite tricarboxylate transporter substrate binding protein [Burkholderiales bacterium]|nr:tripartite tricarboxylate transporter substrate binding protein [Burkholderiales bacterium]
MTACRQIVAFTSFLCFTVPVIAEQRAADYPARPVRVVVGIAPGGGLDTMTRVAAQRLSERIGQTFVVDNRPGGGTVLGTDIVQQATPDGYTLLCASETLMLNGIFKRHRYDVRSAFEPIVRLTTQPYILVVNPSVPASSIKELIDHARAKPGALSFGTPGVGTTLHIGWERLIAAAGINVLHVPYKGGAPAVIDAMSGQIQMVITTTITAGTHIKNGKLKALAVTGPKRVQVYPDVPTLSEAVLPGYELTNSYGLFAPAGTPRSAIDKVNATVIAVMHTPETRKVLAADGAEAAPPATPEEFKAKFARDYAALEKTVAAAKIRLK